MKSEYLYVMIRNANLKSIAVTLIIKILFYFLANHISHNFTITQTTNTVTIYYKRPDKSL